MFTVLLDLLLRPFTKTHTILKDIGSGSFGTVLLTRNKLDDKLYVAKFIKRKKIKDHVPEQGVPGGEGVPLEIFLLSRLKHPNIVGYVDCVKLPQHWVFTMDYLDNYLDLKTFIRLHGRLSEQVSRTILTQTYDALVYCLSAGVDHRDVKHQNILVDQTTLQTKVIDFGLSSICDSKTIYTSVQGTELFLPPEALVQRRYTPLEGTTWSLGCLLYCMVTGRAPFSSKRDVVFTEPHISLHLSALCVDILKQTLNKVRHLRIRFEGIRWHAWMNLDRIRSFLQSNSSQQSLLSGSSLERKTHHLQNDTRTPKTSNTSSHHHRTLSDTLYSYCHQQTLSDVHGNRHLNSDLSSNALYSNYSPNQSPISYSPNQSPSSYSPNSSPTNLSPTNLSPTNLSPSNLSPGNLSPASNVPSLSTVPSNFSALSKTQHEHFNHVNRCKNSCLTAL